MYLHNWAVELALVTFLTQIFRFTELLWLIPLSNRLSSGQIIRKVPVISNSFICYGVLTKASLHIHGEIQDEGTLFSFCFQY